MAARIEDDPELEANMNEMESFEPTESENEVPVVLQCKNCNSIVGDSTAWVLANDDLKTITLQTVTNTVTTGKKMMTSTTEGPDLGSTYVHLLCKQCSEVIGRLYKTTSRQLDSLRDLYTFSVHQIKSYQVGSADQSADVNIEDTLDLASAKTLQASILKTQVMICALNNRILNIENSLEIREDEDGNNGNEDTGQHNAQDPDPDLTEENRCPDGKSDDMIHCNHSGSVQEKTSACPSDVSGVARSKSTLSAYSARPSSLGKRSKELSADSRVNKRSRLK